MQSQKGLGWPGHGSFGLSRGRKRGDGVGETGRAGMVRPPRDNKRDEAYKRQGRRIEGELLESSRAGAILTLRPVTASRRGGNTPWSGRPKRIGRLFELWGRRRHNSGTKHPQTDLAYWQFRSYPRSFSPERKHGQKNAPT